MALAKFLNQKFIDLDDYVQECEGLTVTQLFADGQERFREAESRCLRQILARADEDFVLALGGGTLESESNHRLVLEKTHSMDLRHQNHRTHKLGNPGTSVLPPSQGRCNLNMT